MRPKTMLLVAAVAVAISVAFYAVTGGHFIFFALPLLIGMPFLGRGRG